MSPILSVLATISIDNGVTLIFYSTAAVYILFTTILYYHWHEYSTDRIVSKITAISYLASTLPLIAIMWLVVLQL